MGNRISWYEGIVVCNVHVLLLPARCAADNQINVRSDGAIVFEIGW